MRQRRQAVAARARAQASSPMPIGARRPNSRQGEGRHSWMPQCARTPTVPTRAAQRGGAWSVPRMRQVKSFSSTARPSGTVPPLASSSSRAKSTRKLAQQAPQRVQALSSTRTPQSSAAARTTVTVQSHCATTCADTLPR